MKEVWVYIYEDYQISSLGRFRKKGKILVQRKWHTDYIYKPTIYKKDGSKENRIYLHKNGDFLKVFSIERLVYETFKGEIGYNTVVHLDGDATNVRRSNLVLKKRKTCAKPIYRSDGKMYTSLREAAEDNGTLQQSISLCARGRQRTAGGYGWGYEWPFDVRDVKAPRKVPVKRSDGKVFESISEAAKETGINPGPIYLVIRGQNKTAGGYGWEQV